MTYSLWLHDACLGDTDLAHAGPMPGQRIDGLRPTRRGLELLPGLCGFLGAVSAMKDAMTSMGISDPEQDPARALDLVETTPEGQRFNEIVKKISQLELRDSTGAKAPFQTITVTDLYELGALVPTLDVDDELAQGSPRYIIAAMPLERQSISIKSHTGATGLRLQWHPN